MTQKSPVTEAETNFNKYAQSIAEGFTAGAQRLGESLSDASEPGTAQRLAATVEHYSKVVNLAARYATAWDKVDHDADLFMVTQRRQAWGASEGGVPLTEEAMRAHEALGAMVRFDDGRRKRSEEMLNYILSLASNALYHIEESQLIIHYGVCDNQNLHSVDEGKLVIRSAQIDMEMLGFPALESSVERLAQIMEQARHHVDEHSPHTSNIEQLLEEIYHEALVKLSEASQSSKRFRLQHG